MKDPSKFSRGTVNTFLRRIFLVKTVEELEADSHDTSMKRSLNAFQLVMLGIGAIIGAGIFVLTGKAAGDSAGPAIVISFIIAGIASGLAALCYSEMASMIPVSGSAYTYSYATMGEVVAWAIGWDLILEYLVGAASVSVGWSAHFVSLIENVARLTQNHSTMVNHSAVVKCSAMVNYSTMLDYVADGPMENLVVDKRWTEAPFAWDEATGNFILTGSYINMPALVICMFLTALLVFGIKESAWFNAVIVVIKLCVIVIFIFASFKYINPENWHPFVPPNQGYGKYGGSGIFQAATLIFFAYIGFDAVSTTAQECKKPQRDLPIGIIGSLIICTILYIIVCVCLTGLVPYCLLKGKANPISVACEYAGIFWLAIVVDVGAIAGLASVMLVSLLSQPRIFFSMARDGLFPSCAAKTHPKFGTPVVTTVITGVITGILGAVLPIDILGELTSVGTLFAFVLVSLGVLILRIKQPNLPRKFKVPAFGSQRYLFWIIPVLSAICSFVLICTSTAQTILRLFVWMVIGFIIYFAYGMHHSKLQHRVQEQQQRNMPLQTLVAAKDNNWTGHKDTIPANGPPPPYPYSTYSNHAQ